MEKKAGFFVSFLSSYILIDSLIIKIDHRNGTFDTNDEHTFVY